MNEWFSTIDLVGLNGLPNTPQGINKKARLEKWEKRQKTGTKGVSFLYHISALPEITQHHLRLRSAQAYVAERKAEQGTKQPERNPVLWERSSPFTV